MVPRFHVALQWAQGPICPQRQDTQDELSVCPGSSQTSVLSSPRPELLLPQEHGEDKAPCQRRGDGRRDVRHTALGTGQRGSRADGQAQDCQLCVAQHSPAPSPSSWLFPTSHLPGSEHGCEREFFNFWLLLVAAWAPAAGEGGSSSTAAVAEAAAWCWQHHQVFLSPCLYICSSSFS